MVLAALFLWALVAYSKPEAEHIPRPRRAGRSSDILIIVFSCTFSDRLVRQSAIAGGNYATFAFAFSRVTDSQTRWNL